jgi:hypothetical protein
LLWDIKWPVPLYELLLYGGLSESLKVGIGCYGVVVAAQI